MVRGLRKRNKKFQISYLIEQWGSGINRIISDCKAHGLQTPKIEEKNDFFDVEIIRPIADEKSGKDKVTDDYG